MSLKSVVKQNKIKALTQKVGRVFRRNAAWSFYDDGVDSWGMETRIGATSLWPTEEHLVERMFVDKRAFSGRFLGRCTLRWAHSDTTTLSIWRALSRLRKSYRIHRVLFQAHKTTLFHRRIASKMRVFLLSSGGIRNATKVYIKTYRKQIWIHTRRHFFCCNRR